MILSSGYHHAVTFALSRTEFLAERHPHARVHTATQLLFDFIGVASLTDKDLERFTSDVQVLTALLAESPDSALIVAVGGGLPSIIVASLRHIAAFGAIKILKYYILNVIDLTGPLKQVANDLARKLVRLLSSVLTPALLLEVIQPLLLLAAQFAELGGVSKAIFDEVILPLLSDNLELLDSLPIATISDIFSVCFEILPTLPMKLIVLIGSLRSPQCIISPKSRELITALCDVYLANTFVDSGLPTTSRNPQRDRELLAGMVQMIFKIQY